jgi:hypothetical protein
MQGSIQTPTVFCFIVAYGGAAECTSEINFYILYPLNDFIQHVFILMIDSKPDNNPLGARLALDERATGLSGNKPCLGDSLGLCFQKVESLSRKPDLVKNQRMILIFQVKINIRYFLSKLHA